MKTLLGVVLGLAILSGSAVAAAREGEPLGLPAVTVLKEKCTLTDEEVAAITKIYEEYKPKADEATKKVKDAADKKAAGQELRTLRTEIVGKMKDAVKDEDKKKKLEEACAQQRKKKNNNQ